MRFRVVVAVLALLCSMVLAGCVPLFVAGAGATSAGVDAASSNLPMKTQLLDKRIRLNAMEDLTKLAKNQGQTNVEIVVFNRLVLLLGQVQTAEDKAVIAERIAKIDGVRRVYNAVIVGKMQTVTQYTKDAWITARVKAALIAHDNVHAGHFKVVTEDGVVYLIAQTSREAGSLAAEAASQVPKVRKVVTIFYYGQ